MRWVLQTSQHSFQLSTCSDYQMVLLCPSLASILDCALKDLVLTVSLASTFGVLLMLLLWLQSIQ